MALAYSTHERLVKTLNKLPIATAGISEDFTRNQVMLAGNMLIDTANALVEAQTARRLRDFEFALQDLKGIASELGPESVPFAEITSELEQLTSEMEGYGLSENLRASIDSLIEKIDTHIRAAEKRNFLPPGAEAEPLPHPPSALAEEASTIRNELRNGEFDAPVIDRLASDPDQFELRDYSALADELHGILQ